MTKQNLNPKSETNPKSAIRNPKLPLADLYQILIECQGESQQRELFDRLRREGFKVRLLVM